MPASFSGVALGSVAAGSVLLYASLTGKSVLKSVQATISGQSPLLIPQTYPVSGQDTANATSNAASLPPGSTSQYHQYAFSQFAKYGWGADQQDPLGKLWEKESGWDPNAKNPTSPAVGIPQDITGNTHGGWKGQIDWGLKYIHDRYGTPAMAWAHEQANNWY